MPEADETHPERTTANWVLAALVTVFGLVVFAFAVAEDRADSALLFVALPVLLAAALALRPGRTAHGRVFVVTTIALLLAAVALHEGAICVVLAAPLVYAVAHGSTALIRLVGRSSRTYAVIAVPLLLLPGIEGSGIGPRIAPEQSVEVTRVVALPADQVAARLAAGPRPAPARSVPLRLLGVPTPNQVDGDGLDPGDRWVFGYHGSAHGPGGHLLAEVEASEPGHLSFRFVEDTSITGRWFTWRHADLRWRPAGAGRTQVRITVDYRRGLDPSWYFGPLQNALLGEGVEHLLDMLALR
ncbi:SRPBCC family protein [Micromonospora costi]|uniref:SRPBCC family protein n=1 Tax=Micromonospora costi TaxID=1530042 RepID=UPI0033FC1E71